MREGESCLIGGFIRGLETILEPDQVEIVKKELHAGVTTLGKGEFQNLTVAETAFGSSEAGTELGFHHGRAHAGHRGHPRRCPRGHARLP